MHIEPAPDRPHKYAYVWRYLTCGVRMLEPDVIIYNASTVLVNSQGATRDIVLTTLEGLERGVQGFVE